MRTDPAKDLAEPMRRRSQQQLTYQLRRQSARTQTSEPVGGPAYTHHRLHTSSWVVASEPRYPLTCQQPLSQFHAVVSRSGLEREPEPRDVRTNDVISVVAWHTPQAMVSQLRTEADSRCAALQAEVDALTERLSASGQWPLCSNSCVASQAEIYA